ncbi:MAG: secondary thiamine-phosphate synthase enzyme YjbQ [Caulobacteraceae bacterium]
MLRAAHGRLEITTPGQSLVEITDEIKQWTRRQAMEEGLLTLYCRHTSASLLIGENAAPAVRADLEAFFARLVLEDRALYSHNDEGPDDMPSHIRTALLGVSTSIPLLGGELALGVWQGVFLFEHRRAPHRREILLTLIGA